MTKIQLFKASRGSTTLSQTRRAGECHVILRGQGITTLAGEEVEARETLTFNYSFSPERFVRWLGSSLGTTASIQEETNFAIIPLPQADLHPKDFPVAHS